ncbi:MAG: hypothetical protein M1818_006437 [Claussenomyces sp. TS43310]|nr:MAG: hypothetical protein M1818_006437 [Claussenomyces sp. TS43310]
MSNLLSLAGWTFLPNLVTGWVQSLWYGISIRAGEPKPRPGSQRFVNDRRRINIIVVTAYLLYTVYEADWVIRRASDFYQDLGLPHSASDKEIKSRFRRLAAIHHPDKISSSSALPEDYFFHLKLAQDTLLDPAKRFAYDRFGPTIAEWRQCSSIRDYLFRGLLNVVPYYLGGAGFLYVAGKTGYLQWGRYWRWLTLVVVCVFEVHVATRPYFPKVATNFINPVLALCTQHAPYLPFQLLQLTRQCVIAISIAFSQIGPLLQSPEALRLQGDPDDILKQQVDRLERAVAASDVEASRLIGMEMAPLVGDPPAIKEVRGKIKEWLVQNTIRSDPEVRDALGRLLKRRRVDAPAGARGNR